MIKNKYNYLKYIVVLLLGVYIFFFSSSGYFARRRLVNRISELEYEIAKLQQENEALKQKIELLKNDMSYIAEVARQLGYAKKGEKIYRFKESLDSLKETNTITNVKKPVKSGFLDFYTILSIVVLIVLIIVALLM